MKLLVTGAAGFIGSTYVRLVGEKHEVRVLDALLPCVHPEGARPFRGDPGFEFVHGDVRDAQTVDEALRGVSAVCHLAAMVGLSALGATLLGRPQDAVTAAINTAIVLGVASLSPHDVWQQPILRLVDTAVGTAVGLGTAWIALHLTAARADAGPA